MRTRVSLRVNSYDWAVALILAEKLIAKNTLTHAAPLGSALASDNFVGLSLTAVFHAFSIDHLSCLPLLQKKEFGT